MFKSDVACALAYTDYEAVARGLFLGLGTPWPPLALGLTPFAFNRVWR